MNEYLRTFEVKRTRVHFKDIFRNRYSEIHVDDLQECSSEVLVALDKYYSRVDDISWYLNHTEDLPNLVRDNLHVGIRDLEKSRGDGIKKVTEAEKIVRKKLRGY